MPKFSQESWYRSPSSKYKGSVNSGHTNMLCQKYGRNPQGEFKAYSDICFGYGKLCHGIRDFQGDGQQGQSNRSLASADSMTQ